MVGLMPALSHLLRLLAAMRNSSGAFPFSIQNASPLEGSELVEEYDFFINSELDHFLSPAESLGLFDPLWIVSFSHLEFFARR